MNPEAVFGAVIATTAGALLTAFGAVAKALYERRDARVRAHRELELACRRTAFITEWLGTYRSLPTDETLQTEINRRARTGLDEAYRDARIALDGERAAIARPLGTDANPHVVHSWWRTALLVRRWRRPSAWVIVAVFYSFVALLVATAISGLVDPTTDDGGRISPLGLLVALGFFAAVAWLVCFGLILLIERLRRPAAATARAGWPAPVPDSGATGSGV